MTSSDTFTILDSARNTPFPIKMNNNINTNKLGHELEIVHQPRDTDTDTSNTNHAKKRHRVEQEQEQEQEQEELLHKTLDFHPSLGLSTSKEMSFITFQYTINSLQLELKSRDSELDRLKIDRAVLKENEKFIQEQLEHQRITNIELKQEIEKFRNSHLNEFDTETPLNAAAVKMPGAIKSAIERHAEIPLKIEYELNESKHFITRLQADYQIALNQIETLQARVNERDSEIAQLARTPRPPTDNRIKDTETNMADQEQAQKHEIIQEQEQSTRKLLISQIPEYHKRIKTLTATIKSLESSNEHFRQTAANTATLQEKIISLESIISRMENTIKSNVRVQYERDLLFKERQEWIDILKTGLSKVTLGSKPNQENQSNPNPAQDVLIPSFVAQLSVKTIPHPTTPYHLAQITNHLASTIKALRSHVQALESNLAKQKSLLASQTASSQTLAEEIEKSKLEVTRLVTAGRRRDMCVDLLTKEKGYLLTALQSHDYEARLFVIGAETRPAELEKRYMQVLQERLQKALQSQDEWQSAYNNLVAENTRLERVWREEMQGLSTRMRDKICVLEMRIGCGDYNIETTKIVGALGPDRVLELKDSDIDTIRSNTHETALNLGLEPSHTQTRIAQLERLIQSKTTDLSRLKSVFADKVAGYRRCVKECLGYNVMFLEQQGGFRVTLDVDDDQKTEFRFDQGQLELMAGNQGRDKVDDAMQRMGIRKGMNVPLFLAEWMVTRYKNK